MAQVRLDSPPPDRVRTRSRSKATQGHTGGGVDDRTTRSLLAEGAFQMLSSDSTTPGIQGYLPSCGRCTRNTPNMAHRQRRRHGR